MKRTVLITGAAGNIGSKVAAHFRDTGQYDLRLLDLKPGDGITAGDIAIYDPKWVSVLEGVDTVLHFAGYPFGQAKWSDVMGANILGMQHMLRAARDAKIRRFVFASTNQVMLGYRFREGPVTTDMPPMPLSPYGISKLFGEELGRGFADETGISFIAVRIGYFQRGENIPSGDMGIGAWGQSMWLSNRDMNHAMERCIEAEDVPFAIVNLVSNNPEMRWDIEHTRRTIGYDPQDGHAPVLGEKARTEDEAARRARIEPGTWFDENFTKIEG